MERMEKHCQCPLAMDGIPFWLIDTQTADQYTKEEQSIKTLRTFLKTRISICPEFVWSTSHPMERIVCREVCRGCDMFTKKPSIRGGDSQVCDYLCNATQGLPCEDSDEGWYLEWNYKHAWEYQGELSGLAATWDWGAFFLYWSLTRISCGFEILVERVNIVHRAA